MAMRSPALLFAIAGVVAVGAVQLREGSAAALGANPIRKVVNMLEAIKKKVEAEGEKDAELYKKYMCYCKTTGGELEGTIAASSAKNSEVTSSIKESEAEKAQLTEDLASHKADRSAAKSAMAEATAIREKDAAAFADSKAEYGADVAAIEKAVAALEKGMAGAFLQTPAAGVLRNLVQLKVDMADDDRQEVASFLAAGQATEYAPQSGEIVGILKQLGDTMAKGLAEETAIEEAAIKSYEGLMAAKKKEVAALGASVEKKIARAGELAVAIATLKDELSDTEATLLEDKNLMADLTKNCGTKTSEWDAVVKERNEELAALAETIKILNDDEALDVFKKTLPSAAAIFIQVRVTAASVRARALAAVQRARRSSKLARPQLDFIALALRGKVAGFEKVVSMIDDMVGILKKEQKEDNGKKAYCVAEFDSSDDTKKSIERAISDSEAAIAVAEEGVTAAKSDIEALQAGIKALDKSVAEAMELRKGEHEAFIELMAGDSAAKKLLGLAKNRLYQYYQPALHQPPTEAMLAQVHADVGGGPPETFGAYAKKSDASSGVIAMLDRIIKDLDKEMTVAETEEKESQAHYEQMTADAAAKRDADSKALTGKEATKADAQAALDAHKEDKAAASKELAGMLATVHALHLECDWLLQYFDVRKEARTSEIESLANAKAVLSGADYSLIQQHARGFRVHA